MLAPTRLRLSMTGLTPAKEDAITCDRALKEGLWAPLPDNPEEAAKIATGTLFGGKDIITMPRYFRPWAQGLPKLRENLSPVGEIKYLSTAQKQSLEARLARLGAPPDQRNALIMWAADGVRRLLVVFDPGTLGIRAILKPD